MAIFSNFLVYLLFLFFSGLFIAIKMASPKKYLGLTVQILSFYSGFLPVILPFLGRPPCWGGAKKWEDARKLLTATD